MASKSVEKQIRLIKTTCDYLSSGMYGEVFVDKNKQYVYKIGNISRKEFDTSLKFYKLGLGPKPISIIGQRDNKIFKMEYIHGILLEDLCDKYHNEETFDFEWDYTILLK
ncbi:MAG: hypothetical protein R3321_01925, partial [Nitrososphaeraceae archaeon]|nr:hypothetical protein [Nitrososphaeraceae archaeon]